MGYGQDQYGLSPYGGVVIVATTANSIVMVGFIDSEPLYAYAVAPDNVTMGDVMSIPIRVAFRAVSAMASGTTSLTITTPATVQTGDALVAIIGDQATSAATNAPAGWTRASYVSSAGGRIEVFWAIVGTGGVAASQAVTFTGFTGNSIGAIVAYYNNDRVNPMDAVSVRSNASGTTGAGQAPNISLFPMTVCGFISYANGSTWSNGGTTSNPALAAYTSRLNVANGTTNSIYIVDAIRPNSNLGYTGTASQATMGTPGVNGGAILLIRPYNAGGSSVGTTTGFTASSAGAALVGRTTDGVTTGDAMAYPASTTYQMNTADGITSGDGQSGLLLAVGGTADGVTTGAVTSGALLAIGSTTDGVTTGVTISCRAEFIRNTTAGITSGAVLGGLGKPFVENELDGITTGFITSSGAAPKLVSTADNVTTGYAASSSLAAIGVTSDGVTTALLSTSRWTGAVSSANGVTTGYTASRSVLKVGNTVDNVATGYAASSRLKAIGVSSDGVTMLLASTSTWTGHISSADGVTVADTISVIWGSLPARPLHVAVHWRHYPYYGAPHWQHWHR